MEYWGYTVSGLLLLASVGIFAVGKYVRRLENQVKYFAQSHQSFNSTKTTRSGQPLDGIFEVHITINPTDNYVKLIDYVDQCKEHAMKLVFAVAGAGVGTEASTGVGTNNQYMLSYFTRKQDDGEAVERANQVADELAQRGIAVERVKIEGHGVRNTPMSTADYDMTYDYIKQKYGLIAHQPYFEFHVKIKDRSALSTPNLPLQSGAIEEVLRVFPNTAISYNLCSSNRKPLLTIRVYGKGFIDAQFYKDTVIETLKKAGYTFDDKIQQEFSIYDSNPSLDLGWLLTELPQ